MKTIDARGLACPAPVLKTKDLIDRENPAVIQITVDNDAARQNVSRFLESRKFDASTVVKGDDIVITGKRALNSGNETEPIPEKAVTKRGKQILVMVTTDRIGHGDDTLGLKLMKSFLLTLKEMGTELWRVLFLNSGVKLTIEGSDSLPVLKALENDGVTILVCGTCLDHFHLLDKKQVGETTNMLDIVTSLEVADTVITI